jgi:hypothetical protein
MLPPLQLIFCLLLVSVLISLLSFSQGYWILSRHWAASMMLMAVAVIWLLGEIARVLDSRRLRAGQVLAFGSVTALILMAPLKINEQSQALLSYQDIRAEYRTNWAGTTKLEAQSLWGLEDVQNINIYLGGKVWPVNACFSPVWQNCP